MKHSNITLSIALASLGCIAGMAEHATAAESADVSVAKGAVSHGGKCASGKCGTEKKYGKADVQGTPQGRLVRARDGKCGLTGEGHAVVETAARKLAEGVCGQ
ncbi:MULTISPECIES: hypothetical protein [Stenotrophomonas]|uniref:DUF2282 domain-containing protein n=1 Tax=Stenotrophomonas lactitubi TaxID=2045214 RepID=A0AAW4GKW1_9GAMM|nr:MULTISPECIES: hypothetical protein [Stenotrophomonas]MBM9914540.1 hypothetical protein [Stenotrophomonas lactitubi]MBM9922839.1 hypothetical protein [Stenotrophomonas lactitubi]MBM9938669.1 hypothetical protein [Stenotrophomonas lactitubi]